MKSPGIGFSALALVTLLCCSSGCSPSIPVEDKISIDGSSTVLLVSEAMATTYMKLHPEIDITVGVSGTGGGFKKFAANELDITGASRPIKSSELKKCRENGIVPVEFSIAMDGLSVIINKDNTWAREMTVAQLKKIWHPNKDGFQNVDYWQGVDSSWPSEKLALYGPASTSGTFDYFTEAINGKGGLSRTDYSASEDDNLVIKGVMDNQYAMGFLGYAYFKAHEGSVSAVRVAEKQGEPFVGPNTETILNGTYRPLSRPIFIYVRQESLARPEVRKFVEFYLRRDDLVSKVGYVPLSAYMQYQQRQRLQKALNELALGQQNPLALLTPTSISPDR